jgi:carbon storage regulator
MLVLSRQLGETIMIGRDIEVKVVGIRGGKVSLGIQAPRQVPVNRLEICDCSYLEDHSGRGVSVPPAEAADHIESI